MLHCVVFDEGRRLHGWIDDALESSMFQMWMIDVILMHNSEWNGASARFTREIDPNCVLKQLNIQINGIQHNARSAGHNLQALDI